MIKYTQKGIVKHIDETQITGVFDNGIKTTVKTRNGRYIIIDETLSLIKQRITRALNRK